MSIWRVFFHVINEANVWPAIFTAIYVILVWAPALGIEEPNPSHFK